MQDRLKICEMPLLNSGIRFNIADLTNKSNLFVDQLKVLIPRIQQSSCNLDYEFNFKSQQIWLVIFITSQSQMFLPTFDVPLMDIRQAVIADLKKLPVDLNMLVLESYSVEREHDGAKGNEQEKLKRLIKKKRRDTLSFLLDDEHLNLEFPEMLPYVIDRRIESIQFYIEYIHQNHFKIRLRADAINGFRRKRIGYLKVGNKIFDDTFFFNSAQAMRSRPKKLITLDAYTFRDSVTDDILLYHAV